MSDTNSLPLKCPNCNYIYSEGNSFCPNCGTSLCPNDNAAKAPLSLLDEKTVLLKTYDNLLIAQTDRSLLEVNGIYSILESGNWNSIFNSDKRGPCLFVLTSDFEKALTLISQF